MNMLMCMYKECVNPLPTKVANMQLLDPSCFVCTLEQNRPTHGDVPRQGHKTCFFAKSGSVFAPPPQQNP